MLIVMKAGATPVEAAQVCDRIEALGFSARPIPGAQRVAIGLVGNNRPVDPAPFEALPGVREVLRVSAPYKLVSLDFSRIPR
jgi:3-deoxy-7-phosphoheptulonate synthase